jgi:hypothetical protein
MKRLLEWIRGGSYKSDPGFRVTLLGRNGLRYTEGDRTLVVESEWLVPRGIGITRGSIVRWDPPYDQETIEEADRDRIIANIRKGLKGPLEVSDVWPPPDVVLPQQPPRPPSPE